ncbi:hypothetical protein HNP40_002613 [Mycobacteroides chelonae]|nr:hypothetical protein [Mycobacteroides chelonae]
MPVGPRPSRSAELDKITSAGSQSTNYHDQCAVKLDTRRVWAIPIGVLSFVIALCAVGRLWKENSPQQLRTDASRSVQTAGRNFWPAGDADGSLTPDRHLDVAAAGDRDDY